MPQRRMRSWHENGTLARADTRHDVMPDQQWHFGSKHQRESGLPASCQTGEGRVGRGRLVGSKEEPPRLRREGKARPLVLRAPDQRVDVRIGLPGGSAEIGVERLGPNSGAAIESDTYSLPEVWPLRSQPAPISMPCDITR